jgi:hypothetical protein
MQRVLSKELWKEIRAYASRARRRKVAISYVTNDLIGFRNGDILVVDASQWAIKFGETDAQVLLNLQRKGVQLFDCRDLHAKTVLLDDVAFVSSGNMSKSSAKKLVEAGILTDHVAVVSAVASFIEQLQDQSKALTPSALEKLCKIKVIRRGGRPLGGKKNRKTKIAPLGNRIWFLGVRDEDREPNKEEQKIIDRAQARLRRRFDEKRDDFNWIKCGVRGRFERSCKEGDSIIQVWRSSHAKRPGRAVRATPVLLKQKSKRWTRFYVEDPTDRYAELRWTKFRRLLKEIGYSRTVSANVVREIAPDVAETINRKWKAAFSKK